MQSPATTHGNHALQLQAAARPATENRPDNAARRRARSRSYLHGYATDHAARRRLPRFRVR